MPKIPGFFASTCARICHVEVSSTKSGEDMTRKERNQSCNASRWRDIYRLRVSQSSTVNWYQLDLSNHWVLPVLNVAFFHHRECQQLHFVQTCTEKLSVVAMPTKNSWPLFSDCKYCWTFCTVSAWLSITGRIPMPAHFHAATQRWNNN